MGREAMIRADMEAAGLYSPMFDPTIRQLAKSERELSRAEKAWKAAGGQMVAELVNKTGGKYTAKDPHYAVVDQLLYVQNCRSALERCIAGRGARLRYRWRDGRVTVTRFRKVRQGCVQAYGLQPPL